MFGPPWTIRKIVSKGDYNYAVVPEHPFATDRGYVLEHRIVVENSLCRLLGPDEIIHHVNEQKKDNRIENLIVTSVAEHNRHHNSTGRTALLLRCPWCRIVFVREKRQTHIGKKTGRYTCCSSSCRGSLSRRIQMGCPPRDLEQRLADNVYVSVTQPEEYRPSKSEGAGSIPAGDTSV